MSEAPNTEHKPSPSYLPQSSSSISPQQHKGACSETQTEASKTHLELTSSSQIRRLPVAKPALKGARKPSLDQGASTDDQGLQGLAIHTVHGAGHAHRTSARAQDTASGLRVHSPPTCAGQHAPSPTSLCGVLLCGRPCTPLRPGDAAGNKVQLRPPGAGKGASFGVAQRTAEQGVVSRDAPQGSPPPHNWHPPELSLEGRQKELTR